MTRIEDLEYRLDWLWYIPQARRRVTNWVRRAIGGRWILDQVIENDAERDRLQAELDHERSEIARLVANRAKPCLFPKELRE